MAGRRTVLKGVLAASGAAAAGGALTGAAPTAAWHGHGAGGPGRAGARGGPFTTPVRLRWLGVAGWEIVIDGDRSILVDPYLSRMPCTDHTGALDVRRPLRTDRAAVEAVAARHLANPPELILLSHGHFDHIADVPQLLARPPWQDAPIRTLCDETVRNLLAAMGAPRSRLDTAVQVRGGEYMQFDGYTVEVFRSLHDLGAAALGAPLSGRPAAAGHGCFAPGVRYAPPDAPAVLGDLVEGDTLAYQVSVAGGPTMLFLGAGDVMEREMDGIRPDVVTVPMAGAVPGHGYLERLLGTIGTPRLLMPCHHDDVSTPLSGGTRLAASVRTDAARELAAVAAPGSRVLTPRHLEAVSLDSVLGDSVS